MTGRRAATLLHWALGSGTALRTSTMPSRPTLIVNIVGEHATYHQRFDAPLQSDIVALAGNVSKWARVCASSDDLAADTTDAVAAAVGPPGGIATLVVPADVSWDLRRRIGTAAAGPAGRVRSCRHHRVGKEGPVLGGTRRGPPRRPSPADRGLRATASSPKPLAQSSRRDVPGPTGARRGLAAGPTTCLPRRDGHRPTCPSTAHRPGRHPGTRVVLRLSRPAERAVADGLRTSRPRRSGA